MNDYEVTCPGTDTTNSLCEALISSPVLHNIYLVNSKNNTILKTSRSIPLLH